LTRAVCAAVAIALLVALIAAGCGDDARPATVSAAVEDAWLDKVDDWEREHAPGFLNCAATFEREVGAPPSRSLGQIEAGAQTICDHAAEVYDLFQRGEAAQASDESRDVDAAYAILDELLFSYRPGLGPIHLEEKTGVTDESRIEPTFGKVGSAIAETPLTVRCWSDADWPNVRERVSGNVVVDFNGWASLDAHTVDLAPRVCAALAQFVYGDEPPDERDLADAVATLTHEATHHGPTSLDQEDLVECHAMQRMREAARRLGAPKELAARLARRYWLEIYPLLPRAYVNAECRRGGMLDLYRHDGPWPG